VIRALLIAAALVSSHASVPAFAGCLSLSDAQIRPSALLVACGDGNFFLAGVKWTRWDLREADGSGSGHQNDCTPDCARGNFHTYRVSVRLFRPRTCSNRRREFTRFTFRFVSKDPSGAANGATFKSPFYTGKGCP
jgi:hypothetical protein